MISFDCGTARIERTFRAHCQRGTETYSAMVVETVDAEGSVELDFDDFTFSSNWFQLTDEEFKEMQDEILKHLRRYSQQLVVTLAKKLASGMSPLI